MSARFIFRKSITAMLAAPALVGAVSLAATGGAFAASPCQGPGAPTNTETKCRTAVQIPGNPLRSYDISWVNPHRAEYYLGDRSNAAIDIINTSTLTFKRFVGKGLFVGAQLNGDGTVNNDISGPDGVVTHGRWLYAGDGDSTLKVFDLDGPNTLAQPALNTGGTTRVDEMALTTDGEMLLTVNNAEDPPFANLFSANGDRNHSSVREITKIIVDAAGADIPAMEQPAWDPTTRRFYVSIPVVGGNPAGCISRANSHVTPPLVVTCDGGLLVVDPDNITPGSMKLGAFDPVKNVGLIKLSKCGPNGSTVGPHDNLMLGCTSANNSFNTATLVINATTHKFVHTGGLVGSDEVWFNKGDGRYYTGTNRQPGGAVLGVVNGETNFLIETIPQSSGSHSVAADSKRNLIFVPQSAPVAVVGAGGDTTAVGAGICGSNNGCIGVFVHRVDHDRDDRDHDRDDHDHDH